MTSRTDAPPAKPRPMTQAEAVARLRAARAKYDGTLQRQALDQFATLARINGRMIRARRARRRAAATGDRRKHKRADRLFAQAMKEWHLTTAAKFESIGKAIADIAQASRAAIAAIGMLNAGLKINFKPAVPTDGR